MFDQIIDGVIGALTGVATDGDVDVIGDEITFQHFQLGAYAFSYDDGIGSPFFRQRQGYSRLLRLTAGPVSGDGLGIRRTEADTMDLFNLVAAIANICYVLQIDGTAVIDGDDDPPCNLIGLTWSSLTVEPTGIFRLADLSTRCN